MKKSERIGLNIAALVLAHIIIQFINKMTAIHRPFIIIAYLFYIVYYFLLTQMIYRNRVVFSKQLFDRETPWYKQLGLVKILLVIVANVAISYVTTFISGLLATFEMFAPNPSETLLPDTSTVVLSYLFIWVSYMVTYLILAGINAFTRKKTFLQILGVTLAAAAVFSVVQISIHANALSVENSMTQYVELLEYANTSAAMGQVFRCLIACVIVALHEMGNVGKESGAEASPALSLDDNADIGGGDIASAGDEDDAGEGDVSEDSVNEGN